jgi:hypothetical protein
MAAMNMGHATERLLTCDELMVVQMQLLVVFMMRMMVLASIMSLYLDLLGNYSSFVNR